MIGEYELASRLSYFLWNSMPDDELLALAGKGELRKNLPNQIVRMTKDRQVEVVPGEFRGTMADLAEAGIVVARSQAVPELQ